jgi:hypothetical protein
MRRSDPTDRTISSVNSGHLTSVFCGQPTSVLTLKEQLLWVRTFHSVEELRQALLDWLHLSNEQWLLEQHGFRSPSQVRRDLLVTPESA